MDLFVKNWFRKQISSSGTRYLMVPTRKLIWNDLSAFRVLVTFAYEFHHPIKKGGKKVEILHIFFTRVTLSPSIVNFKIVRSPNRFFNCCDSHTNIRRSLSYLINALCWKIVFFNVTLISHTFVVFWYKFQVSVFLRKMVLTHRQTYGQQKQPISVPFFLVYGTLKM